MEKPTRDELEKTYAEHKSIVAILKQIGERREYAKE